MTICGWRHLFRVFKLRVWFQFHSEPAQSAVVPRAEQARGKGVFALEQPALAGLAKTCFGRFPRGSHPPHPTLNDSRVGASGPSLRGKGPDWRWVSGGVRGRRTRQRERKPATAGGAWVSSQAAQIGPIAGGSRRGGL